MQKMNVESCRRHLARVLAPTTALLLLSTLALPAAAQRSGHGSRGSGHHGHISGHSGHRSGHSSYGAHRYGRSHGSHGYRYHGSRHSGHRGGHEARGHHGYRGHSFSLGFFGYRGAYGYGGHSRYRGAYGNGGNSRYRGAYGYSGSYSRFAPYSSYIYYRDPSSYGYSHDTSSTYVVGGKTYPAPAYQSQIAIPENVMTDHVATGGVATEGGEPYSTIEPYDARAQPARVKLSIEPADASLYLDGKFLGLAADLPEELWIDPGAHSLEIVRPGFTGQQLDLELEAGEELDVDARLEAQTPVPHR